MVGMLGHRRPYTHEEVKQLYPVLTEVECRIVSGIEHRYRHWTVWPHVDYPQTHLWLARRYYTSMQPLVVSMIGDMPGEIVNWVNEHSSRPPEFP
jgi:hypothetical protein